ncbi:methyltransferase domain-containing protein [Pseudotenacibaculum sp. MALMAid0570]|uniref:class I SAM-dependent methyltransferase n=1 Tax=Pseudotenacibaculum sp. MALMAid0570 TaxID=3143938 RepID=UPI0032DF8B51
MEKTDWFTSWFNSPYYHILYQHRNDQDAQLFMQNISRFLQLKKEAHILDLPCGKGRHARYLNSLGYKVTGGDLSENSIAYAKQFENDQLSFKVKDMREAFRLRYDAIFNLFTSFGYFENDTEEIQVLKNMKQGLKEGGVLVLDFLNVMNVRDHLVSSEVKDIDGITFHITREIKDGFILKHISFQDKGQDYSFKEQVKYLDLQKFQEYFKAANLEIEHIFGDYELSEYNEKNSERLILVAR